MTSRVSLTGLLVTAMVLAVLSLETFNHLQTFKLLAHKSLRQGIVFAIHVLFLNYRMTLTMLRMRCFGDVETLLKSNKSVAASSAFQAHFEVRAPLLVNQLCTKQTNK